MTRPYSDATEREVPIWRIATLWGSALLFSVMTPWAFVPEWPWFAHGAITAVTFTVLRVGISELVRRFR